jgi:hypothetical protein
VKTISEDYKDAQSPGDHLRSNILPIRLQKPDLLT